MHATVVSALAALATLVSPVDGVVNTTPKRKFLMPSEITKRMEASPVEYRLQSLDKFKDVPPASFANLLWPQRVPPAPMPKVVRDTTGRRVVTEWKVKAGQVEPLLAKAEERYGKKDFAGAAEKYRAILELDPDYYLVHAGLGDCALFGGDPKTALKHYERAIQINPDDYRPHFYRGNALMELGRKKEAVDSFVESLVLKPRNPILLKHLRGQAERLGLSVQPDLLVPRAFVRKEGKAIAIYFDEDKPHWLAWGNCKAFWMGEPSHREEMTGSADPGWSTLEDMECAAGLVAFHLALVEKGRVAPDPSMKKLEQALEDRLAGAFAVYELGSRIDPQIALKVDPSFREVLRRYVRKYVLGLAEK